MAHDRLRTLSAREIITRRPQGFTSNVKFSAYRQPRTGDHHCRHIFDDGTVKPMTAVYVDGSKLKGRWACHNGQIVLEWGYKHKCDEGPPVVCTPDWGGGIRAVLSVGTRFWRTSYAKWVQKKWAYEETHANARLVGVDVAPILPFVQPWQPLDLNLIVREQEEGPQGLGKRTQTIHISEFFDMYDVHKHFTYTPALVEERFDALLDPSKPRPATPVVPDYPYALRISTIAKACIKFLRIHRELTHQKYAPGGLGHKRAREEFEKACGVSGA